MSWASRQNLLVRTSNRILGASSVVWGSVQGVGKLRIATQIVLDGEIVSVDAVLDNLQHSLFGGIKYGETVVVDGNTFSARCDPFRYGDGDYCRLPLSGPVGVVLPSFRAQPNNRQQLLANAINRTFEGASVVWGAIQGKGLLRKNSEIVIGGEAVMVEAVIENLPFFVFGELKYGDQITVNGDLYIVKHEVIRLEDGAFCRVPVSGPILTPPQPPTTQPLTTTTGLVLTTTTGLALAILPEA